MPDPVADKSPGRIENALRSAASSQRKAGPIQNATLDSNLDQAAGCSSGIRSSLCDAPRESDRKSGRSGIEPATIVRSLPKTAGIVDPHDANAGQSIPGAGGRNGASRGTRNPIRALQKLAPVTPKDTTHRLPTGRAGNGCGLKPCMFDKRQLANAPSLSANFSFRLREHYTRFSVTKQSPLTPPNLVIMRTMMTKQICANATPVVTACVKSDIS